MLLSASDETSMATDRLVWRTRRSHQILKPLGNSSGLSPFPSINYSFRMATEDVYLKLLKTDGATILMGMPDRLFIRAAALISSAWETELLQFR
jgi:hypothetical protein